MSQNVRERILAAAEDLVFARGFNATTVDAILEATGASKGAFFHHFPSKGALGRALIERYAQTDTEVLERYMGRAEQRTDDPAEQVIEFIRGFEEDTTAGFITQPGCLFASFAYEHIPDEAGSDEVIRDAIERWRVRIGDKIRRAVETRPLALPVDIDALADHVFAVFEGGFVLVRATGDPRSLRDQLAQLRAYLTLQLGLAG